MSLAAVSASFSSVQPAPAPSSALPRNQSSAGAALPSAELLRGHKIVEIAHNGNLYKLQATKLGKLILTK